MIKLNFKNLKYKIEFMPMLHLSKNYKYNKNQEKNIEK